MGQKIFKKSPFFGSFLFNLLTVLFFAVFGSAELLLSPEERSEFPSILKNSEPELFFRTFEKIVLQNPKVPSYPTFKSQNVFGSWHNYV